MKQPQKILQRAALLVIAAGLCACASTTLDNSWKNPKYGGAPIGKVLVAGISNQASVRRVFEDTFVDSLQAAGVAAVASHTLIPEDGQIPEDKLKAAVEQAGAKGVLITRLVKRETEISTVGSPMPPPAIAASRAVYYHGYYSSAWGGYYEPVSIQQFTTVVAETTLFAKNDPESVWSGTTNSLEQKDIRKATEDFAKVVIAALKKEGLI